MNQVITGKIQNGKIVPAKKLSLQGADVHVKIFIFSKPQKQADFFGKLKGSFGDGLKYQRKIRNEWK